jgi:hypothetical protein
VSFTTTGKADHSRLGLVEVGVFVRARFASISELNPTVRHLVIYKFMSLFLNLI